MMGVTPSKTVSPFYRGLHHLLLANCQQVTLQKGQWCNPPRKNFLFLIEVIWLSDLLNQIT